MRPWRRSLVARLVTSFLLLSWLTVAALGSLTYLRSRADLELAVRDRLDIAAALKAESLKRWILQQSLEVELLAEMPSLKRLWALLLSPEEQPAVREQAYRELATVFDTLADGKSAWDEILFLGLDSEIRFSTERSREGDYRILDRFFKKGLNETWIEKVYPSPLTHTPTITISTPLQTPDGVTIGVFALHLNLEIMDRMLLERTGIGLGSESYLVDQYNVFLSGRRFQEPGITQSADSQGIENALKKNDGSASYDDFRGRPVLGAYRWIDEMGLALLVEIPQSKAFAPARRSAVTILSFGLAGAAVLGIGVWLLAQRIARPILAVTHSARELADGRLDVRVPVLTQDEIGELARTFNKMASSLEELYSELEVRHKELESQSVELLRRRDELESANEALESTNAELERFTYSVSHDLKNPLVTIRGFLGLLERDFDKGNESRVRDDIARIQSATEHMRKLLDELLELSRIGRVASPSDSILLSPLVREVVETVRGTLDERQVGISVPKNLGTAWGDRLRISEVFQNLIANAANYMGDQSDPRIDVGVRRDGQWLVCSITDNGIGIDPCYHEKIFGLFERLETNADGTGIGLALVKRIVEHHGGKIWVESEGAGSGSAFYFTLPVPPTPLVGAPETELT